MPPVRRNRQVASPLDGHCDSAALDALLLPATPETDAPPAKKKRSHGKAKPSGHIPRPPNAFILFRTDYIRSQVKQNSTPEVSKNLGQKWRSLSPNEKRPWIERAEEEKMLHKEKYPDYKYKPIHRRDEYGNCIRKPRSPNRPRMKPPRADMLDYLPESFRWLEAKPDAEFPNTELPSDASPVSSPPPSPSPAPSLHPPLPSTSYLSHRRSSSVPLAGPNVSFLSGAAASSVYPSSPGYARRLGKRPSTSIDFMGAYGLPNATETYLFPNDPRLGHRRSISAPDFGGELPNFTFPCPSAPQEASSLTPINPVFGTMFDNFSWNTQHVDLAPTRMEYITVQIPPTSNLSNTTSPASSSSSSSSQLSSTPTPSIRHPAPVATFNFSAFEEQMSQFEFHAAASQAQYEDPLALVAQTCLQDAGAVYSVEQQYIPHPGDDHHLPPAPMGHSQVPDLQGYQEGVCYTRRCPEITPPSVLGFNELIVDTY